jgi:hypothetical protein
MYVVNAEATTTIRKQILIAKSVNKGDKTES